MLFLYSEVYLDIYEIENNLFISFYNTLRIIIYYTKH